MSVEIEPSDRAAEAEDAPRALGTIATCSRCGGTDISRDAFARWDAEAGHWVLCGVYDDCTCGDCGADGHSIVEFVLIAPAVYARGSEAAATPLASASASG